jgi:hypothetical protein
LKVVKYQPKKQRSETQRLSQLRAKPVLVSGDELIGNDGEIVADNLRLRTDSQTIVADAFDWRRLLPAATAPRVSHLWQAIRQNREGLAPGSFPRAAGCAQGLRRWRTMLS